MTKLYFDLETYSSCPIDHGTYRYAEDPTTTILMTAWAFDSQEVQVADGLPPVVQDALEDPSVIKVAWNSVFERVVCSAQIGLPVGEYLPPSEWDDPMARANLFGYPASLAGAGARLLRQEDQKDKEGKRLIRLFSQPDRKTGARVMPDQYPTDWVMFKEYCRQDVHTLRELDRAIPSWPDDRAEYKTWQRTEEINDRGVQVDLDLCLMADLASKQNKADMAEQIKDLTGCANPNSPAQLCAWLSQELGEEVKSVAKGEVSLMLSRPDISDTARAVLELRQALGLTAAKKFETYQDMANSDERLRGALRYAGAHSGRWTAKGLNLQNLPHDKVSVAQVEALKLDLQLGRAPDEQALKTLVRPCIYGDLCVVDFSQIEARVLPWLAGDTKTLEHFREGRDLYTETAKDMGPSYSRQDGKIATLALGFGGGWRALLAFGGERMMPGYEERRLKLIISHAADKEFVRLDGELEEHLQKVVRAWRSARPEIQQLWRDLEDDLAPAGRFFIKGPEPGSRGLKLPSGRVIWYRDVRRKGEVTPWGDTRIAYSAASERGGRLPLNRTTLTNNYVQGTARDVLAAAVRRLAEAGYRIVNMVHDEVIVEAPRKDLEDIQRLMTESPPWAAGLPIGADGYFCTRYVKQ